jgi:PadR family transcriptional regulator PadR
MPIHRRLMTQVTTETSQRPRELSLPIARLCLDAYRVSEHEARTAMGRVKGDLLQGTLTMLILKALVRQDLHGYSIARWVEEVTKQSLAIEEGSLYPALRRLEDRGLVTSRWTLSETGRRVRVYSLSRAGRAHLSAEATAWMQLSRAVTLVLRAEPTLV